jgi:hypothetical protein
MRTNVDKCGMETVIRNPHVRTRRKDDRMGKVLFNSTSLGKGARRSLAAARLGGLRDPGRISVREKRGLRDAFIVGYKGNRSWRWDRCLARGEFH